MINNIISFLISGAIIVGLLFSIIMIGLSFVINFKKIFFRRKGKHLDDPLIKKIKEKHPDITDKKAHALAEAIREQATKEESH